MNRQYIKSPESVMVFLDGAQYVVASDHDQYGYLLAALKAGDWNDAENIVKAKDKTMALLGEFGEVSVYGGHVTFKGEPLHNYLVEQILKASDPAPLSLFLDNVMKNPSRRAVQDLYRWCEAGKLPITTDGQILAYKKVTADFKDGRTGTFDNSPGQILSMPRNRVDDDPERTCSTGFHFCSREYLGNSIGGSHLVLVKINPADVVAFPTDYNLSKGRCSRYEVLQEIGRDERFENYAGFYVAAERIKVGDKLRRKIHFQGMGFALKVTESAEVKAIDYDAGFSDEGEYFGRKGIVQFTQGDDRWYPLGAFERYVEPEPVVIVIGDTVEHNNPNNGDVTSTRGPAQIVEINYAGKYHDHGEYAGSTGVVRLSAPYNRDYWYPLALFSKVEPAPVVEDTAQFYIVDRDGDYVNFDSDGSHLYVEKDTAQTYTRVEGEAFIEQFDGVSTPLELVEADEPEPEPEPDEDDETITDRLDAIEAKIGLDNSLDTITERLDAIDHELGLDDSLTPLIARVERAERQLSLS